MGSLSQEVSIIFGASFILLLVAVGIITLVLVYRRKQVEYLHEQTRLKAAFEKELLAAQLEMQEQTLKHISQEVHDNVNHTLGVAKVHLYGIRPEKENGIGERVTAATELVTKAMADLRNLSKTLNADAMLANGIEQAIETELTLIGKSAVFETRFSVRGEPLPIDPKKELILFRIVQEILNNAIKHSGAGLLHIDLDYTPTGLLLTVTDNGKGFDAEAVKADPQRGIGLRNMENRASLIGGSLLLQPQNTGTKIQITLPIIVA